MADTAFATLSPWHGALKRGRLGSTAGEAGVSVAEPDGAAMALVSLRKGSGPDLARTAAARGIDLPNAPGWIKVHGLTVLWAGPGQWLVRRPGSYAEIEADLASWATYATFIDQSQSRAVLRIGGPRVRETLAKGLEIDLHPRAFATGDMAMTVAAGISVLLWQIDDRPTYGLAVPRSMAGSFWDWLSEAAAEFGCTAE